MKKRRVVLQDLYPKAKEQIVSLFFDSFALSSSTVIGAYWPLTSEFDTRPLLRALTVAKFTCALPCITPTSSLVFRVWEPDTPLVKGKFDICEPPPHLPLVTPHILLIPLLAFDRKGYRLGYGRGDYDKYLSTFKAITMGVAFQGQEVPSIPCQDHDVSLHYILTEAELIKCKRS